MATLEYLRTDPDLPPVGIVDPKPIGPAGKAILLALAAVAAVAWAVLAIARGEHVSAVWIVLAAVCSYVIAYQCYARLIEWKIAKPRDDVATPAEELENGTDYLPMDRRVLFGHHFAAIAGAGPLVGPVLAAQMGYLPGTLWIVIGVALAGGVQDYLVLWASSRRRGRSLSQMARDELGVVGGIAALLAIIIIMIMIIAVLGMVVVNALAATKGADGRLHGGSPWGVFSIAMTTPIALLMGLYLRYFRPGKVGEVSIAGFAALLFVIVAGRWVGDSGWGRDAFTLSATTLAWILIVYGFITAILPVWLLLAPRDYLSTFMKVGTIVLLAVSVVVTAPLLRAPAISQFAGNSKGPAFAGNLFPFLFITIACGALSGFHSLIASGTTPKLLQKQAQARMIGYGGMLMESFVAVMAIITASVLDQHLYFAMNSSGLTSAQAAAEKVNALGLGGTPITATELTRAAHDVGETAIYSRTGGAPTLAVGMSQVMQKLIGGTGLKAFWYHFAIMFEALFILTTIGAGTRVARFILSDAIANLRGPARRFENPSWWPGAWLTTAIIVAAWGSVLLMGVTDPLGGIYTLFPLFGIANQLLAAVALTVVTVVVIKKGLLRWAWVPALPLVWDLIVTMTASWQKIFSADPLLGYWKQHNDYAAARHAGKLLAPAKSLGDMDKIVRNTAIQGTLSIVFALLVLVVAVVGLVVCVQAVRRGTNTTTETPSVPSKIFAPSGFLASAAERAVQREWDQLRRKPPSRSPTEATVAVQ